MNNSEKFWEQMAKENKDVLFASPARLWDAAGEFFTFCYENPIRPCNPGDGENFKPQVRPFTLEGFCLSVGCTTDWFCEFKQRLLIKGKKLTTEEQELLDTLKRIEQVIYLQKFSYAAAGLLNSHVITHDLGYYNKKDNSNKIFTVTLAE